MGEKVSEGGGHPGQVERDFQTSDGKIAARNGQREGWRACLGSQAGSGESLADTIQENTAETQEEANLELERDKGSQSSKNRSQQGSSRLLNFEDKNSLGRKKKRSSLASDFFTSTST